MENINSENKKNGKQNKALTIVGIVLCVILIPVLIVNVTLIIRSFTSDEVPSFGGAVPMIVLTDSMYPSIKSGDLIIGKIVNAEDIKEEDVITFFDPAGNGSTTVTHRVYEIVDDGDGTFSWLTKGDNNTGPDALPVPFENLVSRYDGFRLPGLGSFATFMQTIPGLIVCVIVPLLLLIAYDVIRRRAFERNNKQDTETLLAELEALRAQKAAMEPQKNEENVNPNDSE